MNSVVNFLREHNNLRREEAQEEANYELRARLSLICSYALQYPANPCENKPMVLVELMLKILSTIASTDFDIPCEKEWLLRYKKDMLEALVKVYRVVYEHPEGDTNYATTYADVQVALTDILRATVQEWCISNNYEELVRRVEGVCGK